MSTVKEIESAIEKLAPNEVKELLEWIQDHLENELEITDEFKASIERGKQDIAASCTRVR
jgi:cell division septum initiation protein DivIVA